MQLRLLLLLLFASYSFSNAQIIKEIETASDNHSSSTSSDDDYSDESSTTTNTNTYDDYDYYAYDAAADLAFQVFDGYTHDSRRDDSTYKFSALNLLYRRSFGDKQVVWSVPELQFKVGRYYASVRSSKLIEEGVKETENYETIDVQLLGFHTNPLGVLAVHGGIGFLSESYSGNVFAEIVGGTKLRFSDRLTLRWEGRYAFDQGVSIRSESNWIFQTNIVKQEDYAISADLFYTSTIYYETIDLQHFGMGLGLRF